jgi:hypothetical protein
VVSLLFVGILVTSVIALVVRFVKSRGEERLQLKWFAAAAVVVVLTQVVQSGTDSALIQVLSDLAFLCLWSAIGIAVLKYRLYEIDIVISKAVLFGSLAVFITAVYVALVAGVGTLAGKESSTALSAVAAAIVAVAFQPLRQRAGRFANRVVYGAERRRTRCCQTSAGGSAAPMPARTCCRRWRGLLPPAPAPSRSWSGCGPGTSCTRWHHPAPTSTPGRSSAFHPCPTVI